MISEKIKVYVSDKSKFDKHRLMQSAVFLFSDLFDKYDKLYENAFIAIVDELGGKQGHFYVTKNTLRFEVDHNEVAAAVKLGFSYRSFTRSILFCILHELGHGIDLLNSYHGKQSLVEYYDVFNDNVGRQMKQIKELHPDFNQIQVSRNIPEEIFADRFAYKNLAYFEKLYKFDGFLV